MKILGIFLLFVAISLSQEDPHKELIPLIFQDTDAFSVYPEIQRLSPQAQESLIPLFIKQLEGSDSTAFAIRALVSIGPSTISFLNQRLQLILDKAFDASNIEFITAKNIIAILEQFGENSKSSIPLLLQAIKTDLFTSALDALPVIAPISKEVVDVVLKKFLACEDNHIVKIALIGSLGLFKIEQKKITLEMLRLLEKEENESIVTTILNALSNLGEEESLPAIVKSLARKENKIRAMAIKSLGKLILKNKTLYTEETEKLFFACLEENGEVAYYAAIALSWLNKATEKIFPLLVEGLKQRENRYVQFYALNCLRLSENQESVPYLIEALKTEDEKFQCSVLFVLSCLKAKKAIPEIKALLKSEKKLVSYQASATLVILGTESESVTPILLKIIDEGSVKNRQIAVMLFDMLVETLE